MESVQLPDRDRPQLGRYQIQRLIDLRTMIRSRAEGSANAVQSTIYAMAAAAIELGLREHAGIRLIDTSGGTTWAEAGEESH